MLVKTNPLSDKPNSLVPMLCLGVMSSNRNHVHLLGVGLCAVVRTAP